MNVANMKGACQRCLFVGLFREDEIDENHPFSVRYTHLQLCNNINISETKLSSFSRDSVDEMLMSEFRLPRRYINELSEQVYKKSSGLPIFCCQLLNSLLDQKIISYSLKTRQYEFDIIRVDLLQTGKNVAELIASNSEMLPLESQRILRILSCFGIQVDDSMLQLLEGFQHGIVASIKSFVDGGYLDRAGPLGERCTVLIESKE